MRMAEGWKRTRHTWLWYVQITLGLLWLLPLTEARAQDIVILKSHDLEPFNQAMAGFVAACPMHITEYDLRGTKKEESSIIQRLTTAKPRLIVAIGPLAAQVAREHLRDVPMIFVMVSNPPKHGLQGANLAGVSLDIPVQTQLARYKALVPTLKNARGDLRSHQDRRDGDRGTRHRRYIRIPTPRRTGVHTQGSASGFAESPG
jgi:ABC-type uncharacterized transport system substrate-binding protein